MNIKRLKLQGILFFLPFFLMGTTVNAQEQRAETDAAIASINDELRVINNEVYGINNQLQNLRRLSVGGLVQAQWQHNEANEVDNAFQVRRGRIRVGYNHDFASAVLQIDVTEGGFALRDAFLRVNDPWANVVSITAGSFIPQFGFEVPFSSASRETPERSRVINSLFPGMRDVGVNLTLRAPRESALDFLTLNVGLVNGNGPNRETDSFKNIVGRLAATNAANRNASISWALAASYYGGGFASQVDGVFEMRDGAFVLNESIGIGDRVRREYFGVDAQIGFDLGIGRTILRGEYVFGTQPATAGSFNTPTGNVSGNAFSRNFNGFYVYLVQNIGSTPLQLVLKYDFHDPNTDVSGNQVGAEVAGAIATNSTDLSFSTWAVGLNYQLTRNILLMANYEFVRNELSTSLDGFDRDVNDNRFTLRLQYRF